VNLQAELISIGDELLSGRTLNTHGQALGAALSAIGLRLMRDTTIPDDATIIASATEKALERAGLVFVSGGLGPTVDDITRDALGHLLNQKIVLHQPTVEYLHSWYEKRGRTISPAGKRQALVLEKAFVLPNSVGAAPGQRIDLPNRKTLFVLPGPPNEFNAVLEESIVPWLRKRYAGLKPQLVLSIHTKGIGESDIVTILENAGFEAPDAALGFYPGQGKVEIRITAKPEQEASAAAVQQTLLNLLADWLDPDQ